MSEIDRLCVDSGGVCFVFVFGGRSGRLGDFVAEGERFLGAFCGGPGGVAGTACCWHAACGDIYGGLEGVRWLWL